MRKNEKVSCGVLGATGMVGQRFVQLLTGHPWFDLKVVAASSDSAGERYGETVTWLVSDEVPPAVSEMVVQQTEPPFDCEILFSSLPGDVAGPVEQNCAQAGHPVFTNAKAHRMDSKVPLLIPEVNSGHLEVISAQQEMKGFSSGFIVANPNCSAVGLTLALKPIQDAFGVDKVSVVTMQAVSGAGYPGEASMDMIGNVQPYIPGEEEKLVGEPNKMLGFLSPDNTFQSAGIEIEAQCNRVPVIDGHTETVMVTLSEKPSLEDCKDAFKSFVPEIAKLELPTAPATPVELLAEMNRPQPRLDVVRGTGMTVSVGRLRESTIHDFVFTVVSHNTIRGAAGGSVLNAELAYYEGLLHQNLDF